jgi:prophage regulatory protein
MRHDEAIIRLKSVIARTGLSRSTIYRMIAEGRFPKQIRIGIQATGWYESEVEQWMADPSSYTDRKAA